MKKTSRKKLLSTPSHATIEALNHEGRGITHLNGKTTFVHGALPNEDIIFKYTKIHSSFDEGETLKVLTSSPNRATPKCPHYDICGACSLQHLNSNMQIKHKQQVLLEQLQHFGQTQPQEILSPITGPIWGYRHKARLGVRFVTKKNKLLIGFRERNGRFIADINNCEILNSKVGKKIHLLQQELSKIKHFNSLPQIEIAISDSQTALIIRHLQPLSADEQKQLCSFAKQYDFDIYLQPKGIDTIHKIWPTDANPLLSYKIPAQNIELFFHPADFIQINPIINQQMIETAIKLLEPNHDDEILDLFCGLGNFTLSIAKYCKKITAIEISDEMVNRAYTNAKHNHITNAEFFSANLAKDISKQSWAKIKFNKILLDPPRSGALEIIKYFPKLNPQKIVYVSCNPATLARDAKCLIHEQNFILQKVGIMDMFPHTSHVESIALFTKKD